MNLSFVQYSFAVANAITHGITDGITIADAIAIEIKRIGIAVDIIPTPRPAIIVVAGPVSDCLTIERTGDFPVAV